jgi:hypothetical protein
MMLTIREASGRLGLTEHTVRGMCSRENPQLAHFRVGPRRGRIMIAEEECDRYLRSCRV